MDATADGTAFGAIVRLLLLTGQRREKVATMKWADLNADGVWTIAKEAREKGNAGVLRLSALAIAVIASQSQVDHNPYVFPGAAWRHGAGRSHPRPTCFQAWAARKTELDGRLPAGMPHWVLHDLRRTARSLMARAGVPRDHAERVLGHRIGGVEGTYDRHSYEAEKGAALEQLAALIERIVNPPDNVVMLNRRG